VSDGPNLDNAAIAERLDAFATLLDLAEAGFYSARAYRRAAELIRTTKAPVVELVRSGRVRELRGIGAGIEARLRELVETGSIAELDELEREVDPELVGLGRFLGLSPPSFRPPRRRDGCATRPGSEPPPRRSSSSGSRGRRRRAPRARYCSTAPARSSSRSRPRSAASSPATRGAGATRTSGWVW